MDTRAMVSALGPRLQNAQVANVYDPAHSKAFLIKFKVRDRRKQLNEFHSILLEPSVRFHATDFDRETGKNNIPSSGTMKMRKHLRNKRLVDIKQLGLDRVVEFTLENQNERLYLILELFVRGSLVLCD